MTPPDRMVTVSADDLRRAMTTPISAEEHEPWVDARGRLRAALASVPEEHPEPTRLGTCEVHGHQRDVKHYRQTEHCRGWEPSDG